MRSDLENQIERLYSTSGTTPKAPDLSPELVRHALHRGRVMRAREARVLGHTMVAGLRNLIAAALTRPGHRRPVGGPSAPAETVAGRQELFDGVSSSTDAEALAGKMHRDRAA